eukprot:m.266333 g.266333  ORF g.266333 m.266333 type:complete len:321 (-) comp66728_c0_seq1:372-1334(-)
MRVHGLVLMLVSSITVVSTTTAYEVRQGRGEGSAILLDDTLDEESGDGTSVPESITFVTTSATTATSTFSDSFVLPQGVDEEFFEDLFSQSSNEKKDTLVWPIAVAVALGIGAVIMVIVVLTIKAKKAKNNTAQMRKMSAANTIDFKKKDPKFQPSFVDENEGGVEGIGVDDQENTSPKYQKRTSQDSYDASREYQSPDSDVEPDEPGPISPTSPKALDWDVYNVATTMVATPQTGVDVFGNKVSTPVYETMPIGNIRVVPGKAFSHQPPKYAEAISSESDPVTMLGGNTENTSVTDTDTDQEYMAMNGPFVSKEGNIEC